VPCGRRMRAFPPVQTFSIMTQAVRTIVNWQDPGDGSGDVIIGLPPDALAAMNVGLGDSLSIELVDGAIVLRPIRDANTQS